MTKEPTATELKKAWERVQKMREKHAEKQRQYIARLATRNIKRIMVPIPLDEYDTLHAAGYRPRAVIWARDDTTAASYVRDGTQYVLARDVIASLRAS